MKQAKNEDELAALPMWVVVRTADGLIRERNRFGVWAETGTNDDALPWEDENFPVTVLWSYAQEVCPPLPFPVSSGIGGMRPNPHYPIPMGGGTTAQHYVDDTGH